MFFARHRKRALLDQILRDLTVFFAVADGARQVRVAPES